MKKILIIFISLFVLASCQDILEEEFKDPLKYTPDVDQVAPGLFTNAITQWKFYIKDYGEWWWQNSGYGILSYAQITCRYITPRYGWFIDYDDVVNGSVFNQDGFGWFNDYYTRMRNWGLIRDVLEDLEGQDYDDNLIYFKLLTIVKDWGALRNVDLYNSIPYFGAFKGTQGEFFVPYDDPKEIYVAVLDELKTVAAELPGIYQNMSAEGKSLLEQQDLALQGDVDKWVRYANALRLRYAVRLSGVDEALAKQHIGEVIGNLPQTDLAWDIPHVDAASALPGGGTWQRGMYERPYATHISNVILNRMNFHNLEYEEDIDDPRLPVLALPTKYNDYRGVSMDADGQEAGYNAGDRYYAWGDDITTSSQNNSKSMWSHVTYTHNNMPADMFTLGEIDLLLAEVAAKGLASTGKSAGDHINDAVVHSTDFWYEMNGLSDYGQNAPEPWVSLIRPTKPSSGTISSYAGKVKSAYDAKSSIEDQMEIIMQQKYIHINLLRPYMLWGELRRTRHPKLEKMTFQGKVMTPSPERLKYPSTEVSNNTEFYLQVVDQDNWTTPTFLVPSATS
jgi:hypothetical protein